MDRMPARGNERVWQHAAEEAVSLVNHARQTESRAPTISRMTLRESVCAPA